jgi:hypothetical protein
MNITTTTTSTTQLPILNLDLLISVLLDTLNPNPTARRNAELALGEGAQQEGFAMTLLQIATIQEIQIPQPARQAAALALKNLARTRWDDDAADVHENDHNTLFFTIPRGDRQNIRSNIIPALCSIPENDDAIRRVFAETLSIIAEIDFPDNWPTFGQEIVQQLQQYQDRGRVLAALWGLRRTMKKFEHRYTPNYQEKELKLYIQLNNRPPPNPRIAVELLINETFPILLQYAEYLSVIEDDVAAITLRLIGKIVLGAIKGELPQYFLKQDFNQVTLRWFNVFERALARPIPQHELAITSNIDELRNRPWWRIKKISLEISYRIFHYYAVHNFTKRAAKLHPELHHFSQQFILEYEVANKILIPVLQMIEGWVVHSIPTPKRILQIGMQYISTSFEPAKTYKIIRPHLQFILEALLRMMYFTQEDAIQWQESPQDYVTSNLHPTTIPLYVKATACHVLDDMCNLRSKDALDGVANILVTILNPNNNNNSATTTTTTNNNNVNGTSNNNNNSNPPARIDAALLALGSLSDILLLRPDLEDNNFDTPEKPKYHKRVEKYQPLLEGMIDQMVVPHISSPIAHVRARAVWCCGQYIHIQWKSPEITKRVFTALLNALDDRDMIVTAHAASMLQHLFTLIPDFQPLAVTTVQEIVAPYTTLIVQKFLAVMAKFGADSVVAGLRAFIRSQEEIIVGYAPDLCYALIQAFFHYANTQEDEEEEIVMAAMGCLETIGVLLEAVGDRDPTNMMPRLEQVVLPVIAKIMGGVEDGNASSLTYFDDALVLLSYFTFHSPLPLSNDLWSMVRLFAITFERGAFEFLAQMTVCLEHLILRDPRMFLETQSHRYSYGMAMKILADYTSQDTGSGEVDVRAAAELVSILLQQYGNPAVVNLVPNAREIFLPEFQQLWTVLRRWLLETPTLIPSTRARMFEVLESMIFYNAAITLELIGGEITSVLQLLRDTLGAHLLIKKKKMAAIGLISLFPYLERLDVGSRMIIIMGCVELIVNYQRQQIQKEMGRTNNIAAIGNGNGDDEDIEFDGDDNNNIDEEFNEDEDAASGLDGADAWFAKEMNDMEAGEDEEDNPDDYPWPLESIDVPVLFRNAMLNLVNSPIMMELISQMPIENKVEIERILKGEEMLPGIVGAVGQ